MDGSRTPVLFLPLCLTQAHTHKSSCWRFTHLKFFPWAPPKCLILHSLHYTVIVEYLLGRPEEPSFTECLQVADDYIFTN